MFRIDCAGIKAPFGTPCEKTMSVLLPNLALCSSKAARMTPIESSIAAMLLLSAIAILSGLARRQAQIENASLPVSYRRVSWSLLESLDSGISTPPPRCLRAAAARGQSCERRQSSRGCGRTGRMVVLKCLRNSEPPSPQLRPSCKCLAGEISRRSHHVQKERVIGKVGVLRQKPRHLARVHLWRVGHVLVVHRFVGAVRGVCGHHIGSR